MDRGYSSFLPFKILNGIAISILKAPEKVPHFLEGKKT